MVCYNWWHTTFREKHRNINPVSSPPLPLFLPRFRCSSSLIWTTCVLIDFCCWSLSIICFSHSPQSCLGHEILLFSVALTHIKHVQTPGGISGLNLLSSSTFHSTDFSQGSWDSSCGHMQIQATPRQDAGSCGSEHFSFHPQKLECPSPNSSLSTICGCPVQTDPATSKVLNLK